MLCWGQRGASSTKCLAEMGSDARSCVAMLPCSAGVLQATGGGRASTLGAAGMARLVKMLARAEAARPCHHGATSLPSCSRPPAHSTCDWPPACRELVAMQGSKRPLAPNAVKAAAAGAGGGWGAGTMEGHGWDGMGGMGMPDPGRGPAWTQPCLIRCNGRGGHYGGR